MKFTVFGTALAVVLPVCISPSMAWADAAQTLRKTVVNVEAPVAIPLSEPLRDRFGIGTMPAISASLSSGRVDAAGPALARGFSLQWPQHLRIAPFAIPEWAAWRAVGFRQIPTPGTAPGGFACPRSLDRDWGGSWPDWKPGARRGEVAVGWTFGWEDGFFGPSARYLHVLQTGSALDSSDAQLALLGVEIVMHDSHWPAPVAPPPVVVSRRSPKFSIGTAMEFLTTWTSVPTSRRTSTASKTRTAAPIRTMTRTESPT